MNGRSNWIATVREILSIRNILLHVVAGVLLSFCSNINLWLMPILLSRFGICLTGAVYSIVNFVSIFLFTFLGILPDFIGRKPALIVSNFISVLMFALLALWWNNPIALTAILFLGIVDAALYYPAARSLIAESVQKAGLGQLPGTAFSVGLAFSMAATAAGAFVTGYLINTFGYSETFTIFLVLTTISLVLRFFYEETLEKRVSSISPKNPLTILRQISKLKNVRYLSYITAYVSLLGLGSGLVGIYIWIFMERALRMNMFLIGLTVGIMCSISAAMQPFIGKLIDRYGPIASLLMMHIIEVPTIIAFANASNQWLAILLIIISESAGAFCFAGYPILITMVTTEDIRATTYGVLETIVRLAAVPGPAIGAVLWKINPKLVFYTFAVLAVPAVTVLVILRRKLQQGK